MEAEWVVDRHRLGDLKQAHPDWSTYKLAKEIGRSEKWIQKWSRRIENAMPDALLISHSRARKTSSKLKTAPEVINRILELRSELSEELGRIAGQKTILYYLHQDKQLKASGLRLPTSQATIWRILDAHHMFQRRQSRHHCPRELPDPMTEWEIDFADVASIRPQDEGKQAHVVESFNVVDRGTSIAVDSQVSDHYDAEQSLIAMAKTFLCHGLPKKVICDRDPRFVGSWSAEGYPTAFMRFILSLDIELDICPPQRPDLKPYVERYQKTSKYEWILIHQPADLQQTATLLENKRYFYNSERPHQGRSCNNLPPHEAFPHLPSLPSIPDTVDPDRWLLAFHNKVFKRKVSSNGSIRADKHHYHVSRKVQGQTVIVRINAHEKTLEISHNGLLLKAIPIKGLYHGEVDFGDYLDYICKEAQAEWRRLQNKRKIKFRN